MPLHGVLRRKGLFKGGETLRFHLLDMEQARRILLERPPGAVFMHPESLDVEIGGSTFMMCSFKTFTGSVNQSVLRYSVKRQESKDCEFEFGVSSSQGWEYFSAMVESFMKTVYEFNRQVIKDKNLKKEVQWSLDDIKKYLTLNSKKQYVLLPSEEVECGITVAKLVTNEIGPMEVSEVVLFPNFEHMWVGVFGEFSWPANLFPIHDVSFPELLMLFLGYSVDKESDTYIVAMLGYDYRLSETEHETFDVFYNLATDFVSLEGLRALMVEDEQVQSRLLVKHLTGIMDTLKITMNGKQLLTRWFSEGLLEMLILNLCFTHVSESVFQHIKRILSHIAQNIPVMMEHICLLILAAVREYPMAPALYQIVELLIQESELFKSYFLSHNGISMMIELFSETTVLLCSSQARMDQRVLISTDSDVATSARNTGRQSYRNADTQGDSGKTTEEITPMMLQSSGSTNSVGEWNPEVISFGQVFRTELMTEEKEQDDDGLMGASSMDVMDMTSHLPLDEHKQKTKVKRSYSVILQNDHRSYDDISEGGGSPSMSKRRISISNPYADDEDRMADSASPTTMRRRFLGKAQQVVPELDFRAVTKSKLVHGKIMNQERATPTRSSRRLLSSDRSSLGEQDGSEESNEFFWSPEKRAQYLQRTATDKFAQLGSKLGETFVTADLNTIVRMKRMATNVVAIVESRKKIEKVRRGGRRRSSSFGSRRRSSGHDSDSGQSGISTPQKNKLTTVLEALENVEDEEEWLDSDDEEGALTRKATNHLVEVKATILKILAHLCDMENSTGGYSNSMVNVLYSDLMLMLKQKQLVTGSEAVMLIDLNIEVLGRYAMHIDFIHRKMWNKLFSPVARKEDVGSLEKLNVRRKLDLFLHRIHTRMEFLYDRKASIEDLTIQIVMLGKYMTDCRTHVMSDHVVDICMPTILRVFRQLFSMGSFSGESISLAELVHNLLIVIDAIIEQNRHPALTDFLVSILLQRGRVLDWVRVYLGHMLFDSTMVEKAEEIGVSESRLDDYRLRGIKHFMLCVDLIRRQALFSMEELENGSNEADWQDEWEFEGWMANERAEIGYAERELLWKLEFLFHPQRGFIAQYLDGKHGGDQETLRLCLTMMELESTVFRNPNSPFNRKQEYVDFYIGFHYLGFVKFYNTLGQEDIDMEWDEMISLTNAHLGVLFAFTVNKNRYVVQRFFHWHVMDFLLAEISLEHECYVMKGQFLEQETRAEEMLREVPGQGGYNRNPNVPNSLLASLRQEQKYRDARPNSAESRSSLSSQRSRSRSRSRSPNPRGWLRGASSGDYQYDSDESDGLVATPPRKPPSFIKSLKIGGTAVKGGFDKAGRKKSASSSEEDSDSDSSSDGLIATPPRKPPSFIKGLKIGGTAVKGGIDKGGKERKKSVSSSDSSSESFSDSSSDGLIATPPRKPPSFIKGLKIGGTAVKGGIDKGKERKKSASSDSDSYSDSSSDGLVATPPRKPPSFIKSLKIGSTAVKGGMEKERKSARDGRESGRGKSKTNFQDKDSKRYYSQDTAEGDDDSSDESSDDSDGLIATPPRKPPAFIRSLKLGSTAVKGTTDKKKKEETPAIPLIVEESSTTYTATTQSDKDSNTSHHGISDAERGRSRSGSKHSASSRGSRGSRISPFYDRDRYSGAESDGVVMGRAGSLAPPPRLSRRKTRRSNAAQTKDSIRKADMGHSQKVDRLSKSMSEGEFRRVQNNLLRHISESNNLVSMAGGGKSQLVFPNRSHGSNWKRRKHSIARSTTSESSIVSEKQLENEYFLAQISSLPLYQDDEMHVLVLQIILSLMLTESQMLEPLYTSQHPVLDNKPNIPFLLYWHLNHENNEAVAALLCQKSLEMGSAFHRLLKLMYKKLFCVSLYERNQSELLGQGAFGSVYTYRLPFVEVAVKLMDIEQSIDDRCILYDMFSEVLIMDSHKSDPRCARLFDYGVSGQFHWIVMKKYKCSLKTWRLQQMVTFSRNLPLYLNVFSEVLKCLSFLTENNIVHFDIKCDNLLLMPNDDAIKEKDFWNQPSSVPNFKVTICDFGESKVFTEEEGSYTMRNRGTEFIKSPEMIQIAFAGRKQTETFDRRRRAGAGSATDVWSVGCLLYELLTGDFLFEEDIGQFIHRITTEGYPLFSEGKLNKIKEYPQIVEFLDYVLVRDPHRRPTLLEVTTRFKALKDDLLGLNAGKRWSIMQSPGQRRKARVQTLLGKTTDYDLAADIVSKLLNPYLVEVEDWVEDHEYIVQSRTLAEKQKMNGLWAHSWSKITKGLYLGGRLEHLNTDQLLNERFTHVLNIRGPPLENGNDETTDDQLDRLSSSSAMKPRAQRMLAIEATISTDSGSIIGSSEKGKGKEKVSGDMSGMEESEGKKGNENVGSRQLVEQMFEYANIELETRVVGEHALGKDTYMSLDRQWARAFGLVRHAVTFHGKVLVCTGKDESEGGAASFLIGFLMYQYGLTFYEALTFVKDRRMNTHPSKQQVRKLWWIAQQLESERAKKMAPGAETYECLCGACSLTVQKFFDTTYGKNPRPCDCLWDEESECPMISCSSVLQELEALYGFEQQDLEWGYTTMDKLLPGTSGFINTYKSDPYRHLSGAVRKKSEPKKYDIYRCKTCQYVTHAICQEPIRVKRKPGESARLRAQNHPLQIIAQDGDIMVAIVTNLSTVKDIERLSQQFFKDVENEVV